MREAIKFSNIKPIYPNYSDAEINNYARNVLELFIRGLDSEKDKYKEILNIANNYLTKFKKLRA